MPFRLTSPRPAKQVENDVESGCLDYLRIRGYFPVRIHCGKFRSWDGKRVITGAPKGTPDWVFVHARYPGFLLEAKRPGQEPSAEQTQRHREIYMGYKLDIAVIDNVDTLRRWLNEREKRWCRS